MVERIFQSIIERLSKMDWRSNGNARSGWLSYRTWKSLLLCHPLGMAFILNNGR